MDEMEAQGQAQEQQPPQPAQDAPLSQQVKAQIKVPQELRGAYEKIILAGMKVMFSKETNQMAMQSMQGDGPVEQRLAKGVTDLMTILWKESNESLPPQLILPAAVELTTEAADFLNEAGQEEITVQQIGEAIRLMIGLLMQRFGVNEETVKQGAQGAQGQQGQPPQQPPQQPPAERGLIGGAMGGA